MPLISSPTFLSRPSPKESIPYPSEALRQDLERVRTAWGDCQATRDRDAIYGYLSAVYGLVAWWTAEAEKSTELAGRCACSGWRYLGGKTLLPPSFGAPRIQQKPTSVLGANGLASCDTRQSTNRIPSVWSNS
jgi:hypothetical protein